jgi:hypothetical protein
MITLSPLSTPLERDGPFFSSLSLAPVTGLPEPESMDSIGETCPSLTVYTVVRSVASRRSDALASTCFQDRGHSKLLAVN